MNLPYLRIRPLPTVALGLTKADRKVQLINRNRKRRLNRPKRDTRRAIARPYRAAGRYSSSRGKPLRPRDALPCTEADDSRFAGEALRPDRKPANPDRKARRLARRPQRLAIATLGALRASPKPRAPADLSCGRPGKPRARRYSPCDRKPVSLAPGLKPLRAKLDGLRLGVKTSHDEYRASQPPAESALRLRIRPTLTACKS